MEGKNKFSIILLVIIAALAIALACITVFVLVGGGSGSTKVVEKVVETKRPADSDVTIKTIFDKKLMNLKVTEDKKTSVIQISAEVVYLTKVSGIKSVETKMKNYEGEIQELIETYFQNMTLEDAKKTIETKEKAKKDLTKQINDLLCANEKEKKEIVYTINFKEWFYQ